MKIQNFWLRQYKLLLVGLITIFGLVLNTINSQSESVSFKVYKEGFNMKKIDSAAHYEVFETNVLQLKDLNFFQRFISPSPENFYADNMNLLFILTCTIIVLLILWKREKQGVFEASLSSFTKAITNIASVFFVFHTIRVLYFGSFLKNLVDKKYLFAGSLLNPLSRIEFWFIILMPVITYILKQGERLHEKKKYIEKINKNLQQEQELTI